MTTAARTRSWTFRQARYEPETQVVVDPQPEAITRHYVMTRHGAVARTFLPGTTMVNVALWRPTNRHPQFQGTITRQGDRWLAVDSHEQFVATAADYRDAEAALLPLRTRTRSHGSGTWPYEIKRELEWRRDPRLTCENCGQPLTGGVCIRPDLHW